MNVGKPMVCAVCGHKLPSHKNAAVPTGFIALVGAPLTVNLCDECPGGKCRPQPTETNVVLIGFSPIGEMTRKDMIDEMMAFQRRQLERIPVDKLIRLLVNVRIYTYAERVKMEAGIHDPNEDEGTGLIPVE